MQVALRGQSASTYHQAEPLARRPSTDAACNSLGRQGNCGGASNLPWQVNTSLNVQIRPRARLKRRFGTLQCRQAYLRSTQLNSGHLILTGELADHLALVKQAADERPPTIAKPFTLVPTSGLQRTAKARVCVHRHSRRRLQSQRQPESIPFAPAPERGAEPAGNATDPAAVWRAAAPFAQGDQLLQLQQS